jgi:hypothetical protein
LSTSSRHDGSGQSRHVRIPSEFQSALIAGSWLDLSSGDRELDKARLHNTPFRWLEKP